jgi:hypothetical protein
MSDEIETRLAALAQQLNELASRRSSQTFRIVAPAFGRHCI